MIAFLLEITERITGQVPKGARRSPLWPEVRKKHLEDNPRCVICEGKKKLQVHHLVPFHMNPSLELEPTNLITLCTRKKYGINCHLLVGHLGNFRKVNTDCRQDSEEWNRKIKG